MPRDEGKKVIPKGLYCDGKNGLCPYWSIVEHKPDMFNGYCSYLRKGDWELSKESEIVDFKTKKIIKSKGEESDFSFSLLWDQVKECGINMEDEDDIELKTVDKDGDEIK